MNDYRDVDDIRYRLVVVMAGNKREAETWRRVEGLQGRDWVYAGSPRSIEGIRPTRVVCLYGFRYNRYAQQIKEVIRWTLMKQKTPIEIENL